MAHSGTLYLSVSCVATVVLHELAHVAVARSLGSKVKRVGICFKGAYIVRESGPPLLKTRASPWPDP
jgi:membrane-associated protease RseP (regulator of RpoE activity)